MSSIDSAIDLNAGSVSENVKTTLRGELVLAFAVIINSLGVVLMLYSGTGISAISSVPYAFSEVFPKITLGTFTYMFQGLLVLSLMILRKKFVPSYLFSFVVGFIFGECIDMHNIVGSNAPNCNRIQNSVLYYKLLPDKSRHSSF